MKEMLLGKTLLQLQQICAELGAPRFAARQIATWLYQKNVREIEMMTDISKALRQRLAERFYIGHVPPSDLIISSDGTKKYAFEAQNTRPVVLPDGNKAPTPHRFIEAVMIPDDDRRTLCVSSQAGCKMGCHFCMTGRQGFAGNLSAGEIISQFLNVEEAGTLTNTVFMGMGEPLDNWENVRDAMEIITSDWGFGWSPKRITLSSIGVLPTLEQFLSQTRCNLAISLHNPFPEERVKIMPVEKAYGIKDVVEMIRRYDFTGQRRVSFEYTMFAAVNDTKRHADGLIRLLRGLECRINLIRFHKIPDSDLLPSSAAAMEAFQQRLINAGITTTIRASRGEDILAACGMLAGKNIKKDV